ADRVVAVVEVERVRGSAVHQSRIERVDAHVAAEHERGPGGGAAQEYLRRYARRVLAGAGEGNADEIQYSDLGPMNCRRRQFIVRKSVDPSGKFERERHRHLTLVKALDVSSER